MKKNLIDWLYKIAEQNISFNIRHDVFETYDDSTGQRHAYLEHFGYGSPDLKAHPETFKVKRRLVFKNESDEGKDGAVLMVIDLEKASNIELSETRASFNGIIIDLQQKVEY